MSRISSRALILVALLLLVLVALFFALRPESPGPGGSREETFDLAIEGGEMTPYQITAAEGDLVRLRITSDSPLEVHLHGYDLGVEVEPGETEDLSFDATITGRFEIEAHHADSVLGVLLVRPR